MNKKTLILLAFVIPFLTIGAGCAKQDTENQIGANYNNASSTNFYENTKYGFSLEFPTNWEKVKEETKTATIFDTVLLTAGNDPNRYIRIMVVKVENKKNSSVVDYPQSYLTENKTYAYYYSGGGDSAGKPGEEDQKYFDIAKEVKTISKTFKLAQEKLNWKTFLGSQFRFSFNYPNDWFITKGFSEKSQPEAVFVSKVQLKEGGEDLGNLSIVINKSSLEKNIRKNLISREEISFAGRPATKIKFTGDWGPAMISILVPYGDYTFVISYDPEDKDYSSIEKILSSFSFETTIVSESKSIDNYLGNYRKSPATLSSAQLKKLVQVFTLGVDKCNSNFDFCSPEDIKNGIYLGRHSLFSDAGWSDGKDHEFYFEYGMEGGALYYGPFKDNVLRLKQEASQKENFLK